MPRYKLTLEYDGTGLAGWQYQTHMPSVQEYLETAITKLSGSYAKVIAAGRTDAGVHALAQVVHVDIVQEINPYNVLHGINFHLLPLTQQVIVTHAELVDEAFNARFSAIERQYLYRIVNRPARLSLDLTRAWHIPEPLDVFLMQQATSVLIGHHDFTTFRSRQCQSKSPIKTLDELTITATGASEIHITARSRSFLHHQVRNMVGALRMIGNKKWTQADLHAALEAKDRTRGGETAAPQGLYLVRVVY